MNFCYSTYLNLWNLSEYQTFLINFQIVKLITRLLLFNYMTQKFWFVASGFRIPTCYPFEGHNLFPPRFGSKRVDPLPSFPLIGVGDQLILQSMRTFPYLIPLNVKVFVTFCYCVKQAEQSARRIKDRLVICTSLLDCILLNRSIVVNLISPCNESVQ